MIRRAAKPIVMAALLLFLIGWGTPLASTPLHDLHVSKCLIEYNGEVQRLQVSMHIFLDDLEEALRRRGADNLNLCTPREAPESEGHLQEYLRDAFSLRVAGQPVAYAYLGKEISDDLMGVWIYLESEPVAALPNLTVSNTVLLEVFADQKNIASILGPGNQRGVLWFEAGKATATANF